MIRNVEEYVHEKVLVGDGAMGTELYARGVPMGHCYDELNLSKPAIVEAIHRDYIAAGAKLIETNTYGANRYILGKYYDLADRAPEINETAARIAKAAVGWKDILIAASIGPITRPFETEDHPSGDRMSDIFAEQTAALAEGGVDLFILETFADLNELLIAYKAVKNKSPEKPVICSMSFVEGGRTVTGCDPKTAALKLVEAGAKFIGANCGTGPRGLFDTVKALAVSKEVILSAIPNAGLPTFSDGRFDYPAEPDYMAHYAKKFVTAGVAIVGGCCGTGPSHIEAIAKAVGQLKTRPSKIAVADKAAIEISEEKKDHTPTELEKRIAGNFVYTMEIDPPRGIDAKKAIEAARNFADSGGDAINVSDIPMARLRMGALGLAAAIKNNVGIEVILHVTARDRNLIAIQSDILGAYALGIDNILALRGDPPSIGDYPFATGVYDVTTPGIVSILSSFESGCDRLGVPIDNAANFFAGVAINQNAKRWERELAHLEDKIAAGARFVQTQPVFDIKDLDKINIAVNGRIPVIASLMILISERNAEFLHNEVPGISIPQNLRKKLKGTSGKKGRETGIAIARELLDGIKELADGVCFMPPFEKYELVFTLVK